MIFKKTLEPVSDPNCPEDYYLAQAAIAGEPDALNALFTINVQPTCYADRLEANLGMVHEDTLQDFWIKLRNRLHKYNGSTPLHWWLRREYLAVCQDWSKTTKAGMVTVPFEEYLIEAPEQTPDKVLEASQLRFTEHQKTILRKRMSRDPHPINNWKFLQGVTA